MAVEFELNEDWEKEASKPIEVREGASRDEIEAEVKKQFTKRGLTE
ncbi:hypothetical protein [Gordonia shandongensis]|nr:hypothetical protein [Gordonia shandongensis]